MDFLKQTLAVCCLALLLTSCGDNEILTASGFESGHKYYPTGVGKYWVYQVDSTVIINAGTSKRESTTYIRERISSSFLNPNGDTTYVLERSRGASPTGPFAATDLWKLEKTDDRLLRIEENLEFIKMLFPIQKGAKWEGNQFDESLESSISQQKITIYKGWDYEVISDNDKLIINGITYDSVVDIQQANFETFVDTRLSNEYYAPNVGMIKREMSIFDTQNYNPNLPWEDFANRGFKMTQTLVDHN